MEIPEYLAWLLTIIASVIVFVIKWYKERSDKEISTKALQWLVYAISLVVAGFTYSFQLPPIVLVGAPSEIIGAVLAWVGELLVLASPFFAFTTLLYTTLMKTVLEKLVAPALVKLNTKG